MVPLFAFLLFTGVDVPVAGPTAPSADIPQDYRLAADDGPRKAVINLADVATTADGHPWARVYWILERDPPTVFSSYTRFDCATRTLVIEHLWALDQQLNTVGSGEVSLDQAPEAGSAAAQAVDFVCGGRAVQQQRQYLGSDMKAAIRLVDPRFR